MVCLTIKYLKPLSNNHFGDFCDVGNESKERWSHHKVVSLSNNKRLCKKDTVICGTLKFKRYIGFVSIKNGAKLLAHPLYYMNMFI